MINKNMAEKMDNKNYKVILTNTPGANDEVIGKIASLFKISPEKASQLLAKDEFTDNGNWPHQIYVREARRMIGEFVMTENELTKRKPTPEPIGMGSYTIDSHNVQRYITPEGYVQNEGDIGVRISPYTIAYGMFAAIRFLPLMEYEAETIREALVGNYQREHVFALSQALALYDFYLVQVAECDQEIEKALAQLCPDAPAVQAPLPPPPRADRRPAGPDRLWPHPDGAAPDRQASP